MAKLVKLDIEDKNHIHHILIFTESQFQKAKERAYFNPEKWTEAHYY